MPIKVGDRLPNTTFYVMTPDGPKPKTADEIFKGKKIVLFGVPGAFTPTCHRNHLPGFMQNSGAIKAKGVDQIAVTSVNDAFVMDAWKNASGADGKIDLFLADGNGDFAKGVGLDVDSTGIGRGIRSRRYSMIVDDGVVKTINVEETAGKAEVSGADNLMTQL
jgi:glutaredoxin/glutathione-dependent peroxiredoxin